jgi:hypothetical protein
MICSLGDTVRIINPSSANFSPNAGAGSPARLASIRPQGDAIPQTLSCLSVDRARMGRRAASPPDHGSAGDVCKSFFERHRIGSGQSQISGSLPANRLDGTAIASGDRHFHQKGIVLETFI